ncbi:MAG: hypothetical protein JOY84_19525 [Curvibacter sp.]|nr:hypothetical protein [Curvibacter sp.]
MKTSKASVHLFFKIIFFLFLGIHTCFAAPVLWTIPPSVTADGSTVSGAFTYDTVTNTFSSINVTSTGAHPGTFTYTDSFLAPAALIGQQNAVATGTGELDFLIMNAAGLSSTGGASTTGLILINCTAATSGKCSSFTAIGGASVTMTGVLVPSTNALTVSMLDRNIQILLALMLVAFGGVVLHKRRS